MYYVYMLRCIDNSIYTGITTNVEKRFKEHLERGNKGAKYTKTHHAKKIESAWQTENKVLAAKLEYRIKELNKHQKEKIIKNNDNLEEYIGTKKDSSLYKRIKL